MRAVYVCVCAYYTSTASINIIGNEGRRGATSENAVGPNELLQGTRIGRALSRKTQRL